MRPDFIVDCATTFNTAARVFYVLKSSAGFYFRGKSAHDWRRDVAVAKRFASVTDLIREVYSKGKVDRSDPQSLGWSIVRVESGQSPEVRRVVPEGEILPVNVKYALVNTASRSFFATGVESDSALVFGIDAAKLYGSVREITTALLLALSLNDAADILFGKPALGVVAVEVIPVKTTYTETVLA